MVLAVDIRALRLDHPSALADAYAVECEATRHARQGWVPLGESARVAAWRADNGWARHFVGAFEGGQSDWLRKLLDGARHTRHLLGGRFRPSSTPASRRRHTVGPGRGGDESRACESVHRGARTIGLATAIEMLDPEVRATPRIRVCRRGTVGRAGSARSRLRALQPRTATPCRRTSTASPTTSVPRSACSRGWYTQKHLTANSGGSPRQSRRRMTRTRSRSGRTRTRSGRIDRNHRSRSRRRLDVLGRGSRPWAAGADRGNAGPRAAPRVGSRQGRQDRLPPRRPRSRERDACPDEQRRPERVDARDQRRARLRAR